MAVVIQKHLELELDELVAQVERKHRKVLAEDSAVGSLDLTLFRYEDHLSWFEIGCQQERANGLKLIQEFIRTKFPS